MTALLKHKMYSLEGAIKLAILASFSSFVVLSVIAYKMTILGEISYGVVTVACISFSSVNIQTKQKDEACQWEKFCFTLPITRTQVVKSEFISQWCITIVTMALASFFIIIYDLLGVSLSLYDITKILAILFIINVVSQCILYLSGIKLGYGNVDTLIMISNFSSILIYLVPSFFIELLLPNHLLEWAMLDYVYRIVICIVGVIISWVCYLYCNRLVKQQEF